MPHPLLASDDTRAFARVLLLNSRATREASQATMAVIAGADGCGAGWVIVTVDTERDVLEADYIPTRGLADPRFDTLAIDIPIGLTEAGRRRADELARDRLGSPRASSVFPSPIRPALASRTREEASQINFAADGRRVGVQSFAILPKVRDLDVLIRQHTALADRIFEIHPEVSFAAWAGHPMKHSKKRSAGKLERQQFIAARFGSETFLDLRHSLRSRDFRVPADDLADAFAALWSGLRLHSGAAGRLPEEEVRDSVGLPMHIWY